jgi:hypothetical protein
MDIYNIVGSLEDLGVVTGVDRLHYSLAPDPFDLSNHIQSKCSTYILPYEATTGC